MNNWYLPLGWFIVYLTGMTFSFICHDSNMSHFISYVICWFSASLNVVFFPKKGEDIFNKLINWFFFPIYFLLYTIMGYFERNKLRWFKDKWLYINLNQLWKFMDK